MLRVIPGSAACLSVAIAVSVGAAAPAQSPPVRVPESPPELPGAANDASPTPEWFHDHSGHTHAAPADQPPSLVPELAGQAPPATPSALATHGGKLIPIGDGQFHMEVVYDDANRALTIYLPPHLNAAPPDADFYGHASPGGMHAGSPNFCPLEQHGASASRSFFPLGTYGQFAPPVGSYECEFARGCRGPCPLDGNVPGAPFPAFEQ